MAEQTSVLKPRRPREVTLNDLLDKLLEKGLMLHADLVITVAGIPLLGVNLRLALAGMSTMLRYGIMSDWDEIQRATAAQEQKKGSLSLSAGEKVSFSVFPEEAGGNKKQKTDAGSNILNKIIHYFVSEQRKSFWLPGKFSLSGGRLCWTGQGYREPLFLVDSADVRKVALLAGHTGPGEMPVLKMVYLGRLHPQEAYFSGEREALEKWLALFKEAKGTFLETCPACGIPAPARRLLNEGCSACGWVSGKAKNRPG
ncbi:MAG: gas vesicle protein [Bacillota bacterium]